MRGATKNSASAAGARDWDDRVLGERRRFLQSAGLTAAAFCISTSRTAQADSRVAKPPITPRGLVGDGSTDNGPSLREAIARADAAGGGVIALPAGRFFLKPEAKGKPLLVLPAGVGIAGHSRDKTILLAGPDAGHVINAPYGFVTLRDFSVMRTVRVGLDRQPGHNIRLEGEGHHLERIASMDSPDYGIALGQRRFLRRSSLKDIVVADSGTDGIDIKNRLDRTEDVSLDGILIIRCARAADSKGKAALDVRGQCVITGLVVEELPPSAVGLRFRHGEADSANGPGGHGSVARSVVVRGDKEFGGQGIAIHARDVTLENVRIEQVRIGVNVGAGPALVKDAVIARARTSAVRVTPQIAARPQATFDGLAVTDSAAGEIAPQASVVFREARFTRCIQAGAWLATMPGVTFDESCSMRR